MGMPTCPSCIYSQGICEKTGVKIRFSTGCTYHKSMPMTNYNRIISKTPEELAEWIDTVFAECEWCRPEKIDDDCERDCKLCILDWLKQEKNE